MPEHESKPVLESVRRTLGHATSRIRSGLAGRSRPVIALAVLAGVTAVGLSVASFANSHPASPASASAAAWASPDARDSAAQRADRSHRDANPSAPASTDASAAASTSAGAAKKAAEAAAKQAAKKAAAAKAAPKWVLPIPGAEVTSCFGMRWGVLHAGIDFAADENTPERSVGAGTVIAAGWNYSGYGISVVVDHGDGYLTHYAHMNTAAVTVGQKVQPGTILGYEGATGDATGPHLHFEVHQGLWNQIDPAPWLRAHGLQVAC